MMINRDLNVYMEARWSCTSLLMLGIVNYF
mgnify:CR=1 FL=1